jgi:hypothetical protein
MLDLDRGVVSSTVPFGSKRETSGMVGIIAIANEPTMLAEGANRSGPFVASTKLTEFHQGARE